MLSLFFDILCHLLRTVPRRDIWKMGFVSVLATVLLHFPSRALLPSSRAHIWLCYHFVSTVLHFRSENKRLLLLCHLHCLGWYCVVSLKQRF
jgi:hypothetical protein